MGVNQIINWRNNYEKISFINSITRAWHGNTGNTCESSKEGNEIFFDTINNSRYTKKCKGFCRGKKKAKIKEIRYRAGKVTKKANKYWKRAKSITKKKSFSAPYNGWYSVRLKNKAGKYTVRNIQIQCIDKTAPSVKTGYTVANKVGTVSVSAWDSNGISYVGYQKGWLQSQT